MIIASYNLEQRKRAQHEMESLVHAFEEDNKKQINDLKKRRTHEVTKVRHVC